MFCQSCGSKVGDSTLAACASCGERLSAGGGNVANEVGQHVKGASSDAAAALKVLLTNPVGGIGQTYAALGPDKALGAGVVLSLGFAVAASAGVMLGASQWLGSLGVFIGPDGFSGFLALALRFLIIPVSIAFAALGLRRIAGAVPPLAADVFTAGASLVPFAAALLLSGLLGVRNWEISLLLFLFALIYLTLMLYAGLTRVGGMSERAAAPAVPVALLLAGWLCKVVLGSMAGPIF